MISRTVPRLVAHLWARIALIGVLAMVGAQFEAVVLVLIAGSAQAVAAGNDRVDETVGPVTLDAPVSSLAGWVVLLVLLAAVLNLLVAWLRAGTVSRWEAGERDGLFSDFLDAGWPLQSRERASALHTTSMWSGQAGVVLNNLISAVRAGIAVLVLVAAALLIDTRTALLIVVVGGLLFLALRPVVARLRRHTHRAAAHSLDYGDQLSEFAQLVQEVRLLGARDAVDERLRAVSERLTAARTRSGFLQYAMQPAYQYLGMVVVALVLLAGSRTDDLDVAAFGATALLLLRSLTFGQQLQAAYQGVAQASPYAERYLEARERYRRSRAPVGGAPLDRIAHLSFVDVRYRYEDDHAALDGVDLELATGTTVGIVGPSGSGKSTLLQLLLRLREPDAGDLLVDGRPAREVDPAAWHRRFALVPQRSQLFQGTVAENIAFFDPLVTRERIERAAREAGLEELVAALPEGYETVVGPSRRDLSGGQVQRIGIARALARDADVVVLDEPTSALDVHAEAVVQDSLRALAGPGRIVVIVAHRLSTLSVCDRIVVLEGGRVTGQGTMSELARSNAFLRMAVERGVLDPGT